jgi:hypothetical protein
LALTGALLVVEGECHRREQRECGVRVAVDHGAEAWDHDRLELDR